MGCSHAKIIGKITERLFMSEVHLSQSSLAGGVVPVAANFAMQAKGLFADRWKTGREWMRLPS